jgi:hypothetical protein
MTRYFTLEEANAALVEIRPLVAYLLELRQKILNHQPELEPVLQKVAGNGGGAVATQVVRDFERLQEVLRRIEEIGAELKDINTGLLDFRSMRDEREIYLCWRHGEEDICYWHEIDAGFAGRQPL